MTTNNPKEIEKLKQSGRILASVLKLTAAAAKPGVSAFDLNEIAEAEIRKQNAKPAFKNYQPHPSVTPFPYALCVSVNDEVVHGMAEKKKILKDGDIVGLDCGVNFEGYFTDAAVTVGVGTLDAKRKKLLITAKQALENALSQVISGARMGDVSFAMQETAENAGFQVVRELVGHGVGKAVHEDPDVPCFGKKGSGIRLDEGMVLAVEPMVNAGNWKIMIGRDGWTVKTADKSLSAHFEHTILVTKDGFEILTKL